jgi:hypothetical protein
LFLSMSISVLLSIPCLNVVRQPGATPTPLHSYVHPPYLSPVDATSPTKSTVAGYEKTKKKLRQCHKSKWRYTGLVLLLQTHCVNKEVTCRHRLQPLTLHQLQACKVKLPPLCNGSIEIWKERRKHCQPLTHMAQQTH